MYLCTCRPTFAPANLCQQLVLNVLSALLLWAEADRIPSMLPYAVGYLICVLAVYISTADMDLLVSYNKAREFHSRGLSQQVARSSFGKSLLVLLEKWTQMGASKQDDVALEEETKQALERTLLSGLDGMAFSKEQLVDLALRLWHRDGQHYGPCAETVDWLRGTPYFREYLVKDPAFGDVLASTLPESKGRAAPARSAPEGFDEGEVHVSHL